MARCKCKICGAILDTQTAYKVVVKDHNKFYCSQEEYETYTEEKKKARQLEKDIKDILCDIFGTQIIFNTLIFKEWQDWKKIASNEIILRYLQENEHMLHNKIIGVKNAEFNRIKYFSTVLKNSLGDFKNKTTVTRKIKNITIEEYVAKYLDPGLCFSIDVPEEDRVRIIIDPKFEDDTLISQTIKQMTYDEFLATPYWQTITNYKHAHSNYKCEKCGNSTELRTHHKTYTNHGREHRMDVINNDLIVLCQKCHHEVHGISDSDDEI